MPEDLSPGKRGQQLPLRKTYEKIAPQARELGHQLENDEKTAGNLLEQLEGRSCSIFESLQNVDYVYCKQMCRRETPGLT